MSMRENTAKGPGLLLVLMLCCLLTLPSCLTPGKVSKYLADEKHLPESEVIIGQWLNAHELYALMYCGATFPVKEKTTIIRDTLRTEVILPGDSIACPETINKATGKVYTPKVKCPDVSYHTITIKEQKETIQENTALLMASQAREDTLRQKLYLEKHAHQGTTAERDQLRKFRNTVYSIGAILIILAVLYILFKFKRALLPFVVLVFLFSGCRVYDPKYKSHLNDRKPHPKDYKYYYKSKHL